MRFFIELAYKGTHYSGFQIQQNAPSIQQEVEKALAVFYRQPIALTGSSRTDSGVHARQNYFHLDASFPIAAKQLYNLNALLPHDIFIKRIFEVAPQFHARFHATSRLYHYHISLQKNPFLQETAWHYPFPIHLDKLNEAALLLLQYADFTSFSKRNTQTHTKLCNILQSQWVLEADTLVYKVKANRFLRGMVRGLVATMLKVGRGSLSLAQFGQIIEAKDCTKADFSAPPHGLFLMEVDYDFESENNQML